MTDQNKKKKDEGTIFVLIPKFMHVLAFSACPSNCKPNVTNHDIYMVHVMPIEALIW